MAQCLQETPLEGPAWDPPKKAEQQHDFEACDIAHPPDKKRRNEKRQRKRRQSLDGDGSWRITTGERREHERRAEDQSEPDTINLPFLDDEWDTDSTSHDSKESHDESSGSSDDAENSARTVHSDDMNSGNSTKNLTDEQKARLQSLKTMLDSSNARYQQATKNRAPVFAAGIEVKVIVGDYAGVIGVVLDADYIESRALVSIQGEDSPMWIPFRALGRPG